MKKVFLAIAMIGSVFNVKAQVTDTGDNVGIGTTSPSEKLEVNDGDVHITKSDLNSGGVYQLKFRNGSASFGYDSDGSFIGKYGAFIATSDTSKNFYIAPAGNTQFTFTSSGRLGVGTTAPEANLNVIGTFQVGYTGSEDSGILSTSYEEGSLYLNMIEYDDPIALSFKQTVNEGFAEKIYFHQGKFGIGTRAPSEKLEVAGTIKAKGINASPLDIVLGTPWGDNGIVFNATSSDDLHRFNLANTKSSSKDENYFRLVYNDDESAQNGLYLKKGGDIGIGTTTPSEKLEVVGNVKISPSNSLQNNDNVNGLFIENEGSNGTFFVLQTATKGGGKSFSVTNAGDVGIGTTTPSEKLEVNGNIKSTGAIIDNEDYAHSNIRLGHESNDRIYADNSVAESYGGGYFFRVHNDDVTNDYIDAMMIAKNGNIGIGTKKTDDYKLAVAGSTGIIAEKVTVKVEGQWPDYVFTNEYDLPTLKEVEKQIKENGHLQNIPSAKEVEENGVELGDISKNLLQKVEELTLYTIQQEKKLEQQNKEIEGQNKEIQELKVLVNKLVQRSQK